MARRPSNCSVIRRTLLTNGLWDVGVLATDAGGNQGQHVFNYAVTGDMKVGNFSFTVVDLEIPVSGIPIRVTRTYDSRRRFEDLDFGFGWSVGYQDVKVEESRPIVPTRRANSSSWTSAPQTALPQS